jgi:hypothetical protein
MRSKILSRLVVLLICSFPITAFAWGPDGHRIVALIATARLSPAAAAQVKAIFGNATLADVANWADDIRQDRPETGSWHFVDIPVTAKAFDEKRDGNNSNNVIDAIEYYARYLLDKSKPAADRNDALKFLIHFVGDVHQPMHCVDRDGDRGGNKRLVFFLDQPKAVNLHRVWDSTIIQQEMGTTAVTVFASALNSRISQAQADEWSKGTPQDWANQSHEVAVNVCYADVPENGPPPKLGEDYLNRAEKATDEQLERGGVRLAMVLNTIFK